MSIITHLKERHFHIEKYTTVTVSEELGKAFFMLYGFGGELVGYQCYTPHQPKRANHLEDIERRYYTYLSKEHTEVKKTVFGLETIKPETKIIFIVEGVFDACRLHNLGLCALALLGCDIEHIKEQLFLLGIKLVPVCEGDEPGKKLEKLATHEEVIYLPEGLDLGDMTEESILETFKKYLK